MPMPEPPVGSIVAAGGTVFMREDDDQNGAAWRRIGHLTTYGWGNILALADVSVLRVGLATPDPRPAVDCATEVWTPTEGPAPAYRVTYSLAGSYPVIAEHVALVERQRVADELGRLRSLLADVEADLWSDLANDIRFAVNGRWSEGIRGTVVRLIRIVRGNGAHWERVPMVLLDHVYGAVLEVAGVAGPYPSEEELDRLEREIGRPSLVTLEGSLRAADDARRQAVATAIREHAAEFAEEHNDG